MYYIGLDLSVNYSSFTVTEDFKTFTFGSIINDASISQKKKTYFDEVTFGIDDLSLSYTNRVKRNQSNSYSENERDKLVNYIEVSSLLSRKLTEFTSGSSDVVIGIEGMAYGAQGMAVFDIPFLTGIIRRDLLFEVLKSDSKRMFIFPPSELKNAIGCKGNAKKGAIFDAFINEPIIPSVKDTLFYNYIMRNKNDAYVRKEEKNGEFHIGSPFNDIIDSYLSIVKFYQQINQNNQ